MGKCQQSHVPMSCNGRFLLRRLLQSRSCTVPRSWIRRELRKTASIRIKTPIFDWLSYIYICIHILLNADYTFEYYFHDHNVWVSLETTLVREAWRSRTCRPQLQHRGSFICSSRKKLEISCDMICCVPRISSGDVLIYTRKIRRLLRRRWWSGNCGFADTFHNIP